MALLKVSLGILYLQRYRKEEKKTDINLSMDFTLCYSDEQKKPFFLVHLIIWII